VAKITESYWVKVVLLLVLVSVVSSLSAAGGALVVRAIYNRRHPKIGVVKKTLVLEKIKLKVERVEPYVFKNTTERAGVHAGDKGCLLYIPVKWEDFGNVRYLDIVKFKINLPLEDWQVVDVVRGPEGDPAFFSVMASDPGQSAEVYWLHLEAGKSYTLVLRLHYDRKKIFDGKYKFENEYLAEAYRVLEED